MKRGTTPVLKVKLGLDTLSDISSVVFVFKQKNDESCNTKVTKTYPSADVTLTEGIFSIAWTEAETRVFEANKNFYMDTKPTTLQGKILETEIKTLYMNPTLFEAVVPTEEDEDEEEVSADD